MNASPHSIKNTEIRVLHIEDNAAYARLIKESLVDIDHNNIDITHCACLADAFQIVEEKSINVVLLDLSLPDADGMRSVTHLRKRLPEVALVVLTGMNDEDTGLQALQLGAQDYLSKDICESAILVKTVRYAIERQRVETRIRQQARTDGLTGLPNRAYFMDYLSNAIARSQRRESKVALLYLDFDGFKQINDSFGHHQGDNFLRTASQRLKDCLRESDFCARLGGDEFAVVADIEQYSNDYAVPLAEKILASMREPISLADEKDISPCCSIGVAAFSGQKCSPNQDRLIQCADEAMYRAKQEGGDCYRLYDTNLAQNSIKNSKLVLQLRSALKRDQFYLEYQPVVDAKTGHISGLETLLRWQDDQGELIPPRVFIDLLERNQMIHNVGDWVLNEACQQFHRSNMTDEKPLWLTINVSPLQLYHTNFLRSVEYNLTKYNIGYPWLVLEITENVIMDNKEQMIYTIKVLEKMGVVIAIDDFGTGYSSMQYLMDMPAKILKIDRSFIEHLTTSRSHQLITNGMIRLAHTLGKKIVVEGVESKQTATMLTQMKADYLQGFHYSQPVSLDSLSGRSAQLMGTW